MAESRENGSRVILVGNPNVGKTTIFRKLCKKNVYVENPGDSFVELSFGKLSLNGRCYEVIDIPGITSLCAHSEEEMIVRELILHESNNIIVHIVDAKNLKRDLILSSELIEFGEPMILVLNMMDEALQKGIIIDEKAIRDILGMDVVMTIGNEGEGINELKKCLSNPRVSENHTLYPDYIENGIIRIQNLLHGNGCTSRAFALQLLVKNNGMFEYVKKTVLSNNELIQANQIIEKVNNTHNNNLELEIIQQRVLRAIDIEKHAIKLLPVKKSSLGEKFGNYAYHPVYGVPILLSVLVLLYLFVGRFGAGILADYIQLYLFKGYIIPFAEHT